MCATPHTAATGRHAAGNPRAAGPGPECESRQKPQTVLQTIRIARIAKSTRRTWEILRQVQEVLGARPLRSPVVNAWTRVGLSVLWQR